MEELEKEIAGALARGYCTSKNSSKVLDSDLIIAMTVEIIKLLNDYEFYQKYLKP